MGRRRKSRPWAIDHEMDVDDEPERTPRVPEVDLHGLTVDGALRRVAAELARHRAGGSASLVFVTGRGFGSHGGRARIGPEVERWLRSEDAKRLGAASIRRLPHGGAFEVSIRRR